MQGGQLTLSGVTDEEMVLIFQAKAKSDGKLNFLPVNMQVQPIAGVPPRQAYSNVVLHWADKTGAAAAAALLVDLAK